jgi:uncharacterized protein (UPF0332 family)
VANLTATPTAHFAYDGLMVEREDVYLSKARESLAGAESEYANGRYNNCANRCYYSTFQAAVAALEASGIAAGDHGGATWSHAGVQAEFATQLVRRRKLYSSDAHAALVRNQVLRNTADYEPHWVTEIQAERAVRRTRAFVDAVQRGASR